MSTWKEHEIIHQDDDTFIIIKNGYPYHLPNFGEFKKEYAEVSEYILTHPEQVIEKSKEEEILEQEKQNKIAELEKVIQEQKSLVTDYCVEMMMEQLLSSRSVSTFELRTPEEEAEKESSIENIFEIYGAMQSNKQFLADIKEMTSIDDVQKIEPVIV